MFTGLIQTIGHVEAVTEMAQGQGRKINIAAPMLDLAREKIGASIACSGCCLTMTEKIGAHGFSVEVSSETLSKTHIGAWIAGTPVNLEPSLRMGDELGGHLVYGHVDGLAVISAIAQDGACYNLTIRPQSPDVMRFIAPKGSIALDGISLTVNAVSAEDFTVMIIPHTWQNTTLSNARAGDTCHIEIDMLARYVARLAEFSK
ncbi:MAG: riboflavin synthase [Alphaproteobacteria bacterium]